MTPPTFRYVASALVGASLFLACSRRELPPSAPSSPAPGERPTAAGSPPPPESQINPTTTAIAALETLRTNAQNDAPAAVKKVATPEAAQLFDRISSQMWLNIPAQKGWSDFFHGAVFAIVPGSDGRFLGMYYHPFADVALITLWETHGGQQWSLRDLDVAPGEFVRKFGRPPFSVTPAWTQQQGKLPPLCIEEKTQQTMSALAKAFPRTGSGLPRLRRWRDAYAAAQRAEGQQAYRVAAAAALEWNGLASRQFLLNKPVADAMDSAFAQVRAGKLDGLLQTAKDTPAQTAQKLREVPALWKTLHLATYTRSADYCSVCFSPEPPNSFITFTFELKKRAKPALMRIDLINHASFRGEMAARNPAGAGS